MFAAELLESALALLNSGSGTNPASRHQAWKLIDDSAEMGNVDAKVKIGVSKLLGTYYQQVSCAISFNPGFFLAARKKNSREKTQALKKLKHIFRKTQGILQKHSIPPTQPRFCIKKEKNLLGIVFEKIVLFSCIKKIIWFKDRYCT